MGNLQERYPLEWIDEYVGRIKDFVFVRETDGLLIKIPNVSHKLNASGVRVLRRLFGGESIIDLWGSYSYSPEVRKDLYEFFIGLKRVLQGCASESFPPEGVVVKPFALGFSTLPVLSEIAVTYRCNLSCRFCYAGCSCTQSAIPQQEMTSGQAKEVLRIIREDVQIPSVSFTGGEPLLRSDLLELIRYAQHVLGLRVNLITNGTLISGRKATQLRDAGMSSAQVSLESSDESIHEKLTQVQGSYRRTVDAVSHLLSAGVIVHTNMTLNRVNVESAIKMPAFVRSLGLERLSMNLIIPAGTSRTTDQDINIRYDEVSEVIPIICKEAHTQGVEFMWYSPTPICIFNPISHRLGNRGCAACDGLLSVSPGGDVLPCSSWPEPVGNLLTDDFRSIWESVRAQWLRAKKYATDLCQGCEDFALCQGGCPLYWQYFGYDELTKYGGPYVSTTSSTTR